ncbi:MAG: hypothetical protein AAFN77_01145 [Planctomycetota bacterium]
MSNQIDLYCLESAELIQGLYEHEHSSNCFNALQAINAAPLLWTLLFTKDNLEEHTLHHGDDETSLILIAKKTVAFKNLKQAIETIQNKHGGDFTTHGKHFAKYLRACPCKWVTVPGLADFVWSESILKKLYRLLEKPTQKSIANFLNYFPELEHFDEPPTRKQILAIQKKRRAGQPIDDRASAQEMTYYWIFGGVGIDGEPPEDPPWPSFPWYQRRHKWKQPSTSCFAIPHQRANQSRRRSIGQR